VCGIKIGIADAQVESWGASNAKLHSKAQQKYIQTTRKKRLGMKEEKWKIYLCVVDPKIESEIVVFPCRRSPT
jgi:hypothetical protein